MKVLLTMAWGGEIAARPLECSDAVPFLLEMFDLGVA